MRGVLVLGLVLVLLCVFIIPALIVRGCAAGPLGRGPGKASDGPPISVYIESTGQTVKMTLEEYVKGAVAAEVPALFHVEALKVQAVLARTLAVRRMRLLGGPGLEGVPGADISDSPAKGQGWASEQQLRARWGAVNYYRYWARVTQAVEATNGQVVLYGGQPIDPVYHSTCGGRTENSEDVWSNAVPYLRSVECTTDTHAKNYTQSVEFSLSDLERKFGVKAGVLKAMAAGAGASGAGGTVKGPVEITKRTATGRAREVRVGDKTVNANDFRSVLNLRSTQMALTLRDGKLAITTTGYGHGVGLCQYGADGLAKQGKTYEEILKYYYKGVTIRRIFKE